ncbi:Protein BYPASS-related [Macleaya cordata]|uniref:Protein BYPASS-related n=1 Tax=Macleaya cordata TaxID=56857 RepID=A0A200QAG4_MACCD|nr:Protein BYPASS-related [Macleaya cordata]
MRPSSFLCSLSFRFPVRSSSSTVAPLPVPTAFDNWLTAELDNLRCLDEQPETYKTGKWLLSALDISVATQKMTIESLCDVIFRDDDREIIQNYLADTVELLDACNRLRERAETVQSYINSLRIVLHCLEGEAEPNQTALARARLVLNSCEAMEKRCSELEKCSSGLRKLGEKCNSGSKLSGSYEPCMSGTDLHEVLNGSKAVALLACGTSAVALSFKSKHGLPMIQNRQMTTWSNSLHELHRGVKEVIEKRRKSGSSLVLTELSEAVNAAKNLRDLINSRRRSENNSRKIEFRVNVEALKRSCEGSEEGIKPLEGRVNELYRELISVRVALLGILSQA